MESLLNLNHVMLYGLAGFICINLIISIVKFDIIEKYPVFKKTVTYIDLIYLILISTFFLFKVSYIYYLDKNLSQNTLELFVFYLTIFVVLSFFSTNFFQNLIGIWENFREFIRALLLIEIVDKRTLNTIGSNYKIEINYNLNESKKISEDFNKLLKNQGIYHSTPNKELSFFFKLEENVPSKFFFVLKHFEDLNVRNESEIKRLISFSRQNLLLGTLISIAAIVFLLYDYKVSEVIRKSFAPNINIFNYFEYYFPKFSIIVLIEIIAFFFLRLYRNSIIDIKNRQDKKNEIDMQIILLKLSILSNNDENLKEITNILLDSNKVVKEDKKDTNNDSDNQKQYTEIIKELISKIRI